MAKVRPVVAIVGRPNVGKSTLFNKLIGHRVSIVDDAPGVTRDRIYADCDWLKYNFTLIDTGGLDPDADDEMIKSIFRQAELAIETADVIIFVTDVKAGVTDNDVNVAHVLRKSQKPVVLAVNKVDDMRRENLDIYEFYSLGLGEPCGISASQALGLGEMLDAVVAHLTDEGGQEEEDLIKIAVVGKPNVGKSSLVNKLTGAERVIVSPIAGTTRDAIDTPFVVNGQKYVLIDTAGIRKKSRIRENVEHYSIVRAVAAIERADVSVLVINAEDNITEQDTKIAGLIHEAGKAAIIAVNKWDLIEKETNTAKNYERKIKDSLKFMPYAPVMFISAQTGQRVTNLVGLINTVSQNSTLRIATGVLNELLADALAVNPPPTDKGRPLRIFYMTQVSVKPPTFVLFVNNTELFHFSYKRYLENKLREAFGFSGTPIRLIARDREGK